NEVFDNLAMFAGYGFNKSHSAAYGMVTYQTAYLKAHHPVHMMAALMTNDADRTERVVRLINETKGMGIEVRPPDVNASSLDFTVAEGAIRFGLGAVKGVGHSAIEGILQARKDGPFLNLYDFCERVDLQKVNKRVVETLVKCGAFDSLADGPLPAGDLEALGHWRGRVDAAVATAFSLGQKKQADRDAGQGSLFDVADGLEAGPVSYPEASPWSDQVLLDAEKQCLGFYVSGHPLDRYEEELGVYATHTTETLERAAEREAVKIGGVVAELKERRSKRNDSRNAFLTFEDRAGQCEVLVFGARYAEFEDLLKKGEPLLVQGSVRIEGDEEPRERKIICDKVQLLLDAREELVNKVTVQLEADSLDEATVCELRDIFKKHQGDCATYLRLRVTLAGQAHFKLPVEYSVRPTDDLLQAVERLFGRGSVSLG
ncbi:MAG: DNA polymerase III subunit alpha, partial [Myxococcales bacterium]|nr:DNA polymerase III subunit alpha [Myxococcales bacterium]